jgi:hypothetical protein
MGNSKSRHEKTERWSIGINDGNGLINAVQIETSDGQRATVSIENGVPKSHPHVQQTVSREGGTQVIQSPYVVENGVQELPPYSAQTPVVNLNPSVKRRAFTQLAQPSDQDLFLAACKFDDVARRLDIEFAIIGGFSARIFGGNRLTKSLDILIAPRVFINGQYRVRQVIDELFQTNPNVLEYTRPNCQGHIVVTHGNVGVAINFVDCINNIYHFPDLVAETRPDGTPWGRNDPEPTWSYRYIQPAGISAGSNVPVLLPRLLLQQRVLHFTRPQEQDEVDRKKNDINDIAVYLTCLHGSEHQSFTDEEALELLPHVRDTFCFADLYWMGGLEVAKWRWINIPIRDGDWRAQGC